MRTFAGVMKYVGIVLISGILILTFCVGLMFFMPKMRLFGYYFRQVDAKEQSINDFDLTNNFKNKIGNGVGQTKEVQLIIEAHNYDIVIMPTESEAIKVSQETDYIGFLKGVKENEGTPYEKTVAQLYPVLREAGIDKSVPDDGKYHWIFDEPEGLLSMNAENAIIIRVPYMVNGNRLLYNLDIKTHNGDIFLNNSIVESTNEKTGEVKNDYKHSLNVSAMSFETNKGSAYINGVGDGYEESKDKNGKKIAPKQLNLGNLDIKTNGGTFDFRKYEMISVNKKVVLNSKKAKYFFNNLITYNGQDYQKVGNLPGGVVVEGENVEFVADHVYCGEDGFTYKSETGVLKINKLISGKIEAFGSTSELYSFLGYVNKRIYDGQGTKIDGDKKEFYIKNAIPYENTIFTDTAAVTLGTIVGKLGMYNELGDVKIDLLCHQSSIRTENGDIIINKSGVFPDERTKPTKDHWSDAETKYAETSSLILYSIYGNIEVGEYYQDAVVYSKKGKIKLTSKFVEEFKVKGAIEYTKTEKEGVEIVEVTGTKRYYYTDVTTKDGQVWVTSDKNPVRVDATDNATINVVLKDVLPEKEALCTYKKSETETEETYYYSLNPFSNNYMYEFKTQNGTVDASLPLKSYKIRIDSNKITGNIGATEAADFKVKDTDGKWKVVDVQISGSTATQSSILIDARKVVVRSDI